MTTKTDNYEAITNQFIESIEAILEGSLTIPGWVKPWSAIGASRNGFTNRSYRGMNSAILAFKASMMGWEDMRFATYKQIASANGQVNKGEKGTRVVLWKFIKDRKNEGKTIPLLRTFTVFNVNAQSNLTLPAMVKANTNERNEMIEEVVKKTGANITHGGDSACYNPSMDKISMPSIEAFTSSDAYYATLSHELVHWTGHETRLDRPLNEGRFGNEAYAFEELVAELGSSFICQTLEVDGEFQDNHLAYLKSWLKVLKNDTRAIFRASSLAMLATKEILGELAEVAEPDAEKEVTA